MPEKTPSPRRAAYLRTVRREKRRVRIWQIALVAGLFAVWELSCRLGLSDGFLVSSPSRMVQTLWRLCASGELWHHAAVSIGETVLGFTAGTVLGTAIAVAMWWSDTAARILDPYLVVLNALPKTALGPIFIVWMGAGMGAIVTMTLAISLIVTILSMYTGFRTTDPEKLRLMRTLGADKRQILWLLVFPANCPTLFSTLKVNVGLSWVVSHRLRLPGIQHGPGHGQRAGAGAGGGGDVPAGAAGGSILKSSMGGTCMKKQLICICMAALLSLSLLTGCGAGTDTGDTAGTEAKNVTVRLSEVTHSVFYAPQYVAMSQGFFADEGLDIELSNGGGADKVMTAVVSGGTRRARMICR